MMLRKTNAGGASQSRAWLLILLCWLVYASSYLGKVNYSANITQIMAFYGVSKADAGTVLTFFFFSYGVGQVINGLFCKKYNMKWMVFGSLSISAVINLIIGIATDFTIIKWLWLINGIVLSVLWPTLIRLLAEALPQKVLGTSSAVMGTTVATGTMVIYGLSSLYAAMNRFKLSFYTPAIILMVVAVVWAVLYNKAVANASREKADDTVAAQAKSGSPMPSNQNKEEKLFLSLSICVLCFYAIGVNLTKDGLTTWVPTILKEEFLFSDSLSILLTLFLPVLAVFGNAFALKLHKPIPDYVNHCAVVFAAVAVLLGVIIGSLMLHAAIFMLIGLIAANFLASSLNSLLTSIFPLYMRGKVNSGLFAGIINGFCYLGSTISAYGLGVVADHSGWISVFWVLVGFCALALIAWGGYLFVRVLVKRKAKTQSC